ncbi:Crp/Fnr family transcriptional regulator [Novosphingobium terrae]|uniref:Crp/Fnr family transcriptional regulator n=1 Tax=Novosphingobium terrae TaxID=2726189 RepID=UPI00197D89F0|nr:Crp/Fnr family transcriptional regulator [Novosphingobium terrae]
MANHATQTSFALRHFRRSEFLARPTEHSDNLYRIQEGWAGQYRLLKDGRRQITALFLPGEYCEPQWLLGASATLPVVALTPLRAYAIPLDQISRRPDHLGDSAARVFSGMLKAMRGRERWIVNLGCLTATERICDLICEVYDRLEGTGQTIKNRCAMPLTQYEIADIVGISPVHVNRVLQGLRGTGIIELRNRRLVLCDPAALRHMSGPPATVGSSAAIAEP